MRSLNDIQCPMENNGNTNDVNTNDMMRCIVDEDVNTVCNAKMTAQKMEPATQFQLCDSLSSYDANHKTVVAADVSTSNVKKNLLNITPKRGSCDNNKMTVETSGNAKGKRLCCKYCLKRYFKLSRHMQSVHKDEEEVKRFVALAKKSKQRRHIQDSLRKLGEREWNSDAKLNKGVLSTSRRPKVVKKATDYKTCPKCAGIYAQNGFRSHFIKCTKGAFKGERSVLKLSRIVEGRVHENANDRLALEIFPGMQEDDIVRLIRYDWLINIYGNDLCNRYTAVSQIGMIRNKIRMAGRLFSSVKLQCPFVTDFASAFRPKCYDAMLAAIKSDVGKFNPLTNDYGTCSPVLAAVTEVRKIGRMLIAELMKLEDESSDHQKNVEKFVTLMDSYETNTLLKTVRNTQNKRKRVKKQNIPSNQDVNRLATYIQSERIKCFDQLSEQYTYPVWLALVKATIAAILLYNRRRTGETQWALLSEYHARQKIDKDCESPHYTALSEHEKKVARKYSVMLIRGKLDVPVPVLLSRNMEKSIELLLKYREAAGVNNEYLFGLHTTSGPMKVVNACNVIEDFSKKCGADNPASLRGTSLRKHIASFCVTLDLDDAGVDEMAKHMGHSVTVHKKYYRHNTLDRDIVKMSERLTAAQGMIDNIGDDSDDSDDFELEVHVNKNPIIHADTGGTCQVNEVQGSIETGRKRKTVEQESGVQKSLKTGAGRKLKKVEDESGIQGNGIPKLRSPKKKRSVNQTGVNNKKRTRRLAKSK